MKRVFLAMAMTVAVMAMGARDRLYINDFSINAGQTKTIQVLLANDTTYCAMQTDIVLPAGLTIELDGDEYIVDPTSRCSNHAVSTNLLADGAVRVFVSSQSTRAFTGTGGAIVTFSLKAASSFTKGNITLRNNVVVETDGTRHVLANSTAKVNGGTPVGITGDLNGDGNVNAGDVSELYSAILRGAADATYDLNNDGNVNAGDISTLYSIILGQ